MQEIEKLPCKDTTQGSPRYGDVFHHPTHSEPTIDF